VDNFLSHDAKRNTVTKSRYVSRVPAKSLTSLLNTPHLQLESQFAVL